MKRALGILALLLPAACASNAPAPVLAPAGVPIALRNADFEAAPRPGERCPVDWGCVMHSNPDSFRFWLEGNAAAQGTRSLCIERVHPEPFGTAQQSVDVTALRGKAVRLEVTMRGERLDGDGAGPIIIALEGGSPLVIAQNVARIGPEWRRYSIEMTIPPRADAVEVGATLLGGGRACLDEVRLEQR